MRARRMHLDPTSQTRVPTLKIKNGEWSSDGEQTLMSKSSPGFVKVFAMPYRVMHVCLAPKKGLPSTFGMAHSVVKNTPQTSEFAKKELMCRRISSSLPDSPSY
jgi:hypothetical protein